MVKLSTDTDTHTHTLVYTPSMEMIGIYASHIIPNDIELNVAPYVWTCICSLSCTLSHSPILGIKIKFVNLDVLYSIYLLRSHSEQRNQPEGSSVNDMSFVLFK